MSISGLGVFSTFIGNQMNGRFGDGTTNDVDHVRLER